MYETEERLSEEVNNLISYAFYGGNDLENFSEAVLNKKWRIAMDFEIEAIEKNDTLELTRLPKGGKTIGAK